MIQWASIPFNKYLDRSENTTQLMISCLHTNFLFFLCFKYVNKKFNNFPSRKSIHLFMLFLIYISFHKMYYLLSVFINVTIANVCIYMASSTIRNWTIRGEVGSIMSMKLNWRETVNKRKENPHHFTFANQFVGCIE